MKSSLSMDLLQQAYDNNLVQFGENVRQGVNFIRNCCGCCCEAMIAERVITPINATHCVVVLASSAAISKT